MDRMTIIGKDGRARYIIEGDEVTDVRACPHWFLDEDLPCVYCNLYQDEIAIIKE